MELLPSDAKKIEVMGSSVDFFEYIQDGLTHYQFDTSECGPPEPMVNAMSGLRLLDSNDKRLVMINHKTPGGLFAKIEENFDYEISHLDDGRSKVIFKYKEGTQMTTNFANNKCSG